MFGFRPPTSKANEANRLPRGEAPCPARTLLRRRSGKLPHLAAMPPSDTRCSVQLLLWEKGKDRVPNTRQLNCASLPPPPPRNGVPLIHGRTCTLLTRREAEPESARAWKLSSERKACRVLRLLLRVHSLVSLGRGNNFRVRSTLGDYYWCQFNGRCGGGWSSDIPFSSSSTSQQ